MLPVGVQTAVGKLTEECNGTVQKPKELENLKCFWVLNKNKLS